MASPNFVAAGTPNDGLPPNFTPIEEAPRIAGASAPASAPPAAPVATGPYFAATIPLQMQLQPDIMPSRFAGGLGGFRVMPPAPSGVPAFVAASKSVVIQEGSSSPSLAIQVNGIPTATQTKLNLVGTGVSADLVGDVFFTSLSDGLTHGTTPWEIDPSSVILSEDFINIASASVSPGAFTTPWGLYGWVFPSNTPLLNLGTSSWGALYGNIGGSIKWENTGTAGAAASLYMNSANSSASYLKTAWPLLDYPGWKATFVWKHDGGQNASTTATFVTTKKGFYIGFGIPQLPATAANGGTSGFSARPLGFIGLRYDTSTSQFSAAVSSVALTTVCINNVQTTGARYTYSATQAASANGSLSGQTVSVTGFTNTGNNCTNAICVYSDTSGIVLANPSAVIETHAGTATSTNTPPNDTFYTFEAVFNQVVGGSTASCRNNLQGQKFVTNVSPSLGVAHRLDITCSIAGVVTLTLDGSATNTATFTIPPITYTLQFPNSALGINSALTNNYAGLQGICLISGSTTEYCMNASAWCLVPGSKFTLAGFSGAQAAYNGSFVAADVTAASEYVVFFDNVTSNIATFGAPNFSTITCLPALTPFASFGNDDTAAPSANQMEFSWDYVGIAVNPALGAGGIANVTKARYF